MIPERVNIAAEVLDRKVAEGLGGRTAFVWDGGGTTYAALLDRVRAVAGALAAAGVRRGTKVLVRMPNCIEFAVSFLALARIGAVPVLVNSLLGQEEVDYVLDHSGAEAAVTLADIAGPVLAHRDRVRTFLWRGEHPGAARLDGAGGADAPAPADTARDEPAFMVYTSGTTGRPKGIVHAHRWVVALGEANRYRVPPEPGDVALATGEWSFISALGPQCRLSAQERRDRRDPRRPRAARARAGRRRTVRRHAALLGRDGLSAHPRHRGDRGPLRPLVAARLQRHRRGAGSGDLGRVQAPGRVRHLGALRRLRDADGAGPGAASPGPAGFDRQADPGRRRRGDGRVLPGAPAGRDRPVPDRRRKPRLLPRLSPRPGDDGAGRA